MSSKPGSSRWPGIRSRRDLLTALAMTGVKVARARLRLLERLTEPPEQCTCTDLNAGQGQERLMDVRPPLITDPQPSVLMDPRQRPFHRPARLPQAALVVDPLLGQDRLDPCLLQPSAMRFGVV